MIFRNCAIDETDYGGEFDPVSTLFLIFVPFFQDNLDPVNPVMSPSLKLRVHQKWQSDSRLKHFFMNILVNNSVVVNKTPHKDAIEVSYITKNV